MTTRVQRRSNLERELAETRRLLEQAGTLLGDSEKQRVALRDNLQRLEGTCSLVSRQLQSETENGVNSGDAAAVLAYLALPTGSLNEILAKFEETAVRLGISPKVKRAATRAIQRASAEFAASEWPDDKLRERAMAYATAEPGADPLADLEMLMGLGPRSDAFDRP